MRRDRTRVRPFRRADAALKHVRSSAGIPARTTRAPGRTASTAASTAAFTPAASIATSTPCAAEGIPDRSRLAPVLGREDLGPEARAPRRGGGAAREVGGQEAGRPGRLRHLQAQETDRAAAEDAHARSRPDVGEVHGVERDPERLEQGAVGIGEPGGQGTRHRSGHAIHSRRAAVVLPGRRSGSLDRGWGDPRGRGRSPGRGWRGPAPRAARPRCRPRSRGRGRAAGRDRCRRSPPPRTSGGRSRRARPPDPHERLALAGLWPLLLVQAHVALPVEGQAAH